MFKAIKNFLFGKPDITPAPYKVETPAAVIGVEGAGEAAKMPKKSPPPPPEPIAPNFSAVPLPLLFTPEK